MRKKLQGVLAGVYALLIALLLLNNCHGCDGPEEQALPPTEDTTAEERASNIGNDGDIKITLLWDFPGDVDLHVTQPNGNELYFQNMRDRSTGGELDVDNRQGGRGSAENIYWRTPPEGRYLVELVMYRVDSQAPRGGQAKVVVKVNDQSQTFTVNLSREGQRETVNSFYYRAQ